MEREFPIVGIGQRSEVSRMTRFLLGPDSRYITRQLINVNCEIVSGRTDFQKVLEK